MRTLLLVLASLLALPAAAQASAPGTVRLGACEPSLEAEQRSVTFEGRVRAQKGSLAMALRFTLQARMPGKGWKRVAAAGFDEWLVAAPGVRRYTYDRTVRNLVAPAAYRTVVRFRWVGADGDVVARGHATSPVCAQPDLRPDLEVRRLEVLPVADPALRNYVVEVRNAGGSPAGASELQLDFVDQSPVRADVPALAPGQTHVAWLVAPACTAGEPVRVTLDPAGVVDEADEADGVVTAPCPT